MKNKLVLLLGIFTLLVSIFSTYLCYGWVYDGIDWGGELCPPGEECEFTDTDQSCVTWIRSPENQDTVYAPVNVSGLAYDQGTGASGMQMHVFQAAEIADYGDTVRYDSWITIGVVYEYGMTDTGTGSEVGRIFPRNFWYPNPGKYLCRLFGLDNAGNYNAAVGPNCYIVNGTLDTSDSWLFNSPWTHDAVNFEADHSSNGTGTLVSSTPIVSGKKYNFIFTVKNLTAGTVKPSCGGITGDPFFTVVANGTFGGEFITTSTAALTFTPSNDARLSIDDVCLNAVESSVVGDTECGWYGTDYGDTEKVNIIEVEVP